MSELFKDQKAFNGNISKWNTSKVTNMNGMFWYAKAFNGDISKWDTSKVTNMNGMFWYAKAFNGNITNWKINNVTSMSYMFAGASAFNQDLKNNWTKMNKTIFYNGFAAMAIKFKKILWPPKINDISRVCGRGLSFSSYEMNTDACSKVGANGNFLK